MKSIIVGIIVALLLGVGHLGAGIYDDLENMHYQRNRRMTIQYGNEVTTLPNLWIHQHCRW